MSDRIVICVDGLAGTGKTAISKRLAEKLGFVHFSTGMLYRAVGYLALEDEVNILNGRAIAKCLELHDIELKLDKNLSIIVLVDGNNVVSKLYTPEVSEAASKVSELSDLRDVLVALQQEAFIMSNLVAEGRDMGTVIFPNARLKFFIKADPEVRLQRRLEQLKQDLAISDPEEFKALQDNMRIEITERDKRDQERKVAPTIQAKDAILIDNSNRPLKEVVRHMYDIAMERISS